MRFREPILFTVSYGAGLVTGLLHFEATAGVGVVVLLAGWMRRRPLIILLASAMLLGNTSGRIGGVAETTRCVTRLPAGALSLSVRLVEPVDSSGGRIPVHPLIGCTGSVPATWPPYQAMDAGFDVAVVARWIPRAGIAGRASGTLVISRVGSAGGAPSPPARLRSAITGASRTLYGARAPMVDALILGRRSGIERELQDRFAQSGLVHLLSISGFHVGIITAWIFLLCLSLRVERGTALGIGAGASVVYVAFLGWPAPATRAAALAVLLALSRIRQRHVEPDSLLSATCLCVLLVDPWAVVDLGGWLSVAALWGATTFSRWTDRALGTGMWWRTLGSSIGATLATAPITSAALGAVAVVGIGLNFLAIPLAAIAVPGVLASLLLYPLWSALAESLASGAGLALHLLELLAIAGSAVPWGHTIESAELESAVPWAAALAVSLWCIGKRNSLAEAGRRWSWVVVVLLWGTLLYAWSPGSAHTASGLTLHFLDVGQGDGAVLRTPAGRWVVIDAGPRTAYSDAGRRVVVPFLMRNRVRELAALIVSHAHADHLGGVSSILERFPATLVLEPGERVADPLYYEFLDGLTAKGIPWHPARRDERFVLDGVAFTVLHPDPQWHGWGEDVNEDSLVLLVEYGSFQALFSGDAGFPAETEMRGRARAVDLLKVGHHGSRGSTGDEWLDSLRPRAAVISVGQNKYGHPSPPTLQRLRGHRVDVWRTDRDGVVAVNTDGIRMTITSDRRSVTYEVR